MRGIDVTFYAESFSIEELKKLRDRKVKEVSKFDDRNSKNASRSRSKLLNDIASINQALMKMAASHLQVGKT